MCGVTFGWPESDEGERPRVTDDGPLGSGDQIRREEDLGSDFEIEQDDYDNGLSSSDAWKEWETDGCDAWNDTSWKVRECPEGDGAPVERQLPGPPIITQGTLVRAEQEEGGRTRPSLIEDTQIPPSPETRDLTPSPQKKDTSVDCVSPPASSPAKETESPHPPQSFRPPDSLHVKAPDTSLSSTTWWPTGDNEKPDGHDRGTSPTGPGLGRKRVRRRSSDNDHDGMGRGNWKRRATDGGG